MARRKDVVAREGLPTPRTSPGMIPTVPFLRGLRGLRGLRVSLFAKTAAGAVRGLSREDAKPRRVREPGWSRLEAPVS